MNRPKTRAQCEDVPRPCPFVRCRYHLYLDVHRGTGRAPNGKDFEKEWVSVNHDCEPWELEESCALDVAEDGEHSIEDIGHLLGLSRMQAHRVYRAGIIKAKIEQESRGV